MATISLTFTRTGLTPLYAFPESASLADYTTLRKAVTEREAPNLGQYTFDTGESTAKVWKFFLGSGTPADWSEALPEVVDITDIAELIAESSPTLVVSPGILKQVSRNFGTVIDLYQGETGNYTTTLFDDNSEAVNLSGGPYTIYIDSKASDDPFDEELTISGDSNNQITFPLGTLCDELKYDYEWAIRHTASQLLKAKGKLNVRRAPGA
jgi:hypothetical protein